MVYINLSELNMKSKQVAILEALHKNKWSQKDIAEDLGVSESYISQIVQKSRMLRISPKFKDGELICAKCEKETDRLIFHHNHSTGEYIALVCESCNIRFYKNDFEYFDGDPINRKMHYPVTQTVRMSQDTKERLDKVAEAMNIAHSELIRKILEDYLK